MTISAMAQPDSPVIRHPLPDIGCPSAGPVLSLGALVRRYSSTRYAGHTITRYFLRETRSVF